MFVTRFRDGSWSAIWQGEGAEAASHVDFDGTRDVVVAWAWAQPAATRRRFDDERNQYVPLEPE